MTKTILFAVIYFAITTAVSAQTRIKLEDDNKASEFYFNEGYIGIGTKNPKAKLHISALERNAFRIYKEGKNKKYLTIWQGDSGAVIEPINNVGGSSTLYLGGYDSVTNIFMAKKGGNVGVGTTNTNGFKFAVAGRILAKDVKIAAPSDWPDYVFSNTYELPTLVEVGNYIKRNGHLKDMPSIEEVQKNGLYLAEMNAKLLKKIEELTLYTIAQEKKINAIEFKNTKLEKENNKVKLLAKRVLEIEKILELKE